MDWDDLRIFLQLSRAGQMAIAARTLGLDDSTVGRRVARLEGALGVPLILRAGRRTILTEKGQELARAAEELESIVLRKVSSIEGVDGPITGSVRVGAPEGLGIGFLAERLAEISAVVQGLEIELVALPRSYSLAAREVDIAITLERPRNGQLTTQKLTDYQLALFGTQSYIERCGEPKLLTELPSHRLVGYIPELLFTSELDFIRITPDIELKPKIRSTSVIAQMKAIESGAAIGVLPVFLAAANPQLKRLLAQDVSIERAYWMSIHDDMKGRLSIRHLLDQIRQSVRSNRRLFLGPV